MAVAWIVFTAIAVGIAVWWMNSRSALVLPPGPRGLPILGNALQMPKDFHEHTFAEWGQQHGDVVYVKLFRTPAIILGSVQAAHDLLEKRGANYSGRPRFAAIRELMGFKTELPFLPYGPRFRQVRKWFHDVFEVKAALHDYQPLQRREVVVLLNNLLLNLDAYAAHFHRFASAIILEVIYGHSVTTDDDEFMLRAREAVTAAAHAGSPGSTLVDVFPLLKHYPTWLPGSNFKVSGNHIRRIRDIMVDLPYNMVKSQMELGNYPTSFTASLLETYALDGSLTLEDEEYIKGSAATFLGAGTDTVSSAMTTFILAMVRHPHVFKKAQEEIDSVVNSNRLPQLDDRNSLPYLDCIIKEVYRWCPPVPLAPHTSDRDDEYQGYHIPAGSMVIPNIWGISREAERYPEPSAFNPERYMNGTEDLDPKTYIFGFGRRICPGQYYADSSIFLVAANILATMNISMAKDEAGIAIIPPLEFVSGISTHPKPFRVSIKPRSPRCVELIQGYAA